MLGILLSTLIVVVLLGAMIPLLGASWRGASRAWRLLAFSGIPLAASGWSFVLRFWDPTSGPYLADVRYPFGSHLNAWAVSFGFTWIAFGLLFAALALLGPASRTTALLLGAAWLLCWLPHGVIGVGFALAGGTAESLERYQAWGSNALGAGTLFFGALLLLLHLCSSLAGFFLVARSLYRGAQATR